MREVIFQDRRDAGRRLAERLEKFRHDDPVILGLPRGGVIVAHEVAIALGAELDVVVARKVGAPFQPELAIGAVAPNDVTLADERYHFSENLFTRLAQAERREMTRRIRLFRGEGSELPALEGRTVIVVDDGLATGLTARAAALAVRKEKPRRLIVASPVGSYEAISRLREAADEVVCLSTPETFFAIGQWYVDFTQVTDDEVVEVLKSRRDVALFP
jgi:putative phosphoribosyl transferase